MKINEIEIIEYEAFEKIININLFNKLVSFIMESTNIENLIILNRLKREHIWFKIIPNNDIQTEYNFRYLGELLERYEERENVTIKEIRAIALAIAYTKDLINKDMIIGTQLTDFINKIYDISNDDIYLKGALYVYDKDKYENLFEELVSQNFNTTEDVIFVLSIFDDTQRGFEQLNKSLIKLLGKSKTISVIENVGIYNWIIKRLYSFIKSNRKKGLELIKALISIPTSFIKQDSKFFEILLENNYTKEEIAFMNYVLIHYQSVPDCVKLRKSIVEEKIAINCCKVFLNSENIYSDYVYNLITSMLNYYRYFGIKCYGFSGIKEAIADNVNIKIPEVFIKFYKQLNRSIHSFDILNEKWDIVQNKFDKLEYENLFDNYLQSYDYTKEEIEKRIDKYQKLVKSSYIESFYFFNYERQCIFSILVEKDIINLNYFFEKYIIHKDKYNLEHLAKYVSGITTRKSFLFFKYFLNLKEFTIKDIKKYDFDINCLYHKSYGWYTDSYLNIGRDFLSLDEQKELFMWLEKYIFFVKPESYINFVLTFLNDDIVSTLFSKDELKKIYNIASNIDDDIKNNKYLREKYLSAEELELLIKKEKEDEEKRKLIEHQKKESEIADKFRGIEKTLKKINKFYYSYTWDKEKSDICSKIVKEYFNNNLEKRELTYEEIISFNEICSMLIEQEKINIEELKCYVTKYIGNGELKICKE